ncbi:MAG: hypothetical protein EBZ50_02365 [Alphaproteobacteria bacterium]|nr:hypothetical protein [Alphaproteobacteria bacterium]
MLFLAAFALIFALVAIRRAIPILAASAVGVATWATTHDVGATAMSSISALIVACWLLDVASRHTETRAATVALEMTVGAFGAAVFAAMIAHGLNGNVAWVSIAAAIGAAGIVARWRQLAF